MNQQPIAELIRLRSPNGGPDADLVVCLAKHEEELLKDRPELRARRRHETKFVSPPVVLFLPALQSLGLPLFDLGPVASVDRNMSG